MVSSFEAMPKWHRGKSKSITSSATKDWRSKRRGWAPLAYPSSSLFTNQHLLEGSDKSTDTSRADSSQSSNVNTNGISLNIHFPLHKDVILAAAREMLLLDGSIHNFTLQAVHPPSEKWLNAYSVNPHIIQVPGQPSAADSQGDEAHINDQQVKCKIRNNADGSNFILKYLQQCSFRSNVDCKTRSDENEKNFRKHAKRQKLTTSLDQTPNDMHGNSNSMGKVRGYLPTTQQDNTEFFPSAEELANVVLNQSIIISTLRTELPGSDNVVFPPNSVPQFVQVNNVFDPDRSLKYPPVEGNCTTNLSFFSEKNLSSHTGTVRPPRKVSDVDAISCESSSNLVPHHSDITKSIAIAAFNLHPFDTDLTESVKRLQRTFPEDEHLASASLKAKLPSLLQISIIQESYLRNEAYRMTLQMTKHFQERTLRDFLGYRSTSMKRDELIRLISDYLFDVSHAMFAWVQTDQELFGRSTPNQEAHQKCRKSLEIVERERDMNICSTLLDDRALKRIGDFEPYSLLTHALSIGRLRAKGIQWKTHAKTRAGRKMFRHHLDFQTMIFVGQKRRGQRTRHRSLGILQNQLQREEVTSRFSSITSTHEQELEQIGSGKCSISECSFTNSTFKNESNENISPDLLSLTITRDEGKSWGILLAKEGSMCVVMRAPDGYGNGQDTMLQKGDLIFSIRSEDQNEIVYPSVGLSHHSNNVSSFDGFGDAVRLFKKSNKLLLRVRRVSLIPRN